LLLQFTQRKLVEAGLEERWFVPRTIYQIEEAAGFCVQAIGGWRFEAHPMAAEGATVIRTLRDQSTTSQTPL
jgi:hypothetical protein